MDKIEKIIEINNMQVSFTQYIGKVDQKDLQVIRDLSLSVDRGEILAIVGSSGSGKSLLAHGILGLLPYNSTMKGQILYKGMELDEEMRRDKVGSEIVIVPQSLSFLDPLSKIGKQILKGRKDRTSREKLERIFQGYELDKKVLDMYPFQLSGGMQRRVLVSTAMMEDPDLVIADEPTPGLDLKQAKRVMEHFRQLADRGAAVLIITHDLELAVETADRVAVFYGGFTVEEARASDFEREETLRHPYTKALWRAMPENGFNYVDTVQPYDNEYSAGCPYYSHCPYREVGCIGKDIEMRPLSGGRVRCIKNF